MHHSSIKIDNMANYYTDHPELEFHLHHPLMKRIVELKERNFADKDSLKTLLLIIMMQLITTIICSK